jgi:type IV secretion system protein VirB1
MIVPDLMTLAQHCAPEVAPATMTAIVRTESASNPYAIGVVGGRLVRQPSSLNEAMATVHALEAGHWNYSVGLAQVNRANWSRLKLNPLDAFDACRNLAAGGAVLQGCFRLARANQSDVQRALRQSLSCYVSGDFVTGYRIGYVQRVVDNAGASVAVPPRPMVPAIAPSASSISVVPTDPHGLPARGLQQTGEVGHPGTPPSDPPQPERDENPDNSAVVF